MRYTLIVAMYLYIAIIHIHIGISTKSAEVVVACAFQAHFIKEVSRQQLTGAARVLLTKDDAKDLRSAEKRKFVKPLAMAFLKQRIVGVKKGPT